jgi:hypothetical protein
MTLQATTTWQAVLSTTSENAYEIQAKLLATQDANKYGDDFNHLWATLSCENPTFNPTQQSLYFKNGIQEQSFGDAQINLPENKDITYAEATDPIFSINFIAEKFSEGDASKWSCWRKLYP